MLIVVDTLRADRLGCYGYQRATSPRIDEMAQKGTLYEDVLAQGSWTVPSMISLMTGLYVTDTEEALPVYAPTLAEMAQAKGIKTAAFVANGVLAGQRGFERGFDHFQVEKKARAHRIVGAFQSWYLDQVKADGERATGFFAWLHPSDPHAPYQPIQKFQDSVGEPPAGRSDAWVDPTSIELAGDPLAADDPRVETFMKEIRLRNDLYDGEVRAVDDAVGELLIFLENRGELEHTLLVFASDHGEELGEHVRYPEEVESYRHNFLKDGDQVEWIDHVAREHGELTRTVTHTPLILIGPGIPAGVRRQGLGANVDIVPTVLEALGLESELVLAGQSLMGGVDPTREQVFCFGHQTSAVVDRRGMKLIDRREKVDRVLGLSFMLGFEGDMRPLELFDLNQDEGERRNLAGKRPQAENFLEAQLDRWRTSNRRQRRTEVSEEDLRHLEEMGYLGVDH